MNDASIDAKTIGAQIWYTNVANPEGVSLRAVDATITDARFTPFYKRNGEGGMPTRLELNLRLPNGVRGHASLSASDFFGLYHTLCPNPLEKGHVPTTADLMGKEIQARVNGFMVYQIVPAVTPSEPAVPAGELQ